MYRKKDGSCQRKTENLCNDSKPCRHESLPWLKHFMRPNLCTNGLFCHHQYFKPRLSGTVTFISPPCAYLLFFLSFSFISFILLLLPFHIIIHVRNFPFCDFPFDLFIVVLRYVVFCYFTGTGTSGSLYFFSYFTLFST